MLRFAIIAVCAMGCNDPKAPIVDAGMQDGDDAAPDIDAPRGPCWPVDNTTPGGTILLGTGEDAYQPMQDETELVYGPQGGFHVVVNSRISGLSPGNPNDVLDPINPRTRFRAFFVDTGEPINPTTCPIRIGYMASPESGSFDLAIASAILYQVGLPEDMIFDRQLRVVVEIIDGEMHYATAEKLVIPRKPAGWGEM